MIRSIPLFELLLKYIDDNAQIAINLLSEVNWRSFFHRRKVFLYSRSRTTYSTWAIVNMSVDYSDRLYTYFRILHYFTRKTFSLVRF